MNIGALGVYVCLFIALYFEVFLLITFFEKRPAKKSLTRPSYYPSVSMVVPCFNEEATLAHTVESLLALDYPKNKLEILVVDDGSTDQTANIARSFASQGVKYFYKENGGKYTALNFGIEHSTAELVGCLDADSFVAKDALLEVAKKMQSDPTIMATTPAMQVYRPRSILETMQAVEYTFGIFYKKMFDNISAVNVLPGPFSLYRREVFEKIGLFRHAHNTEDMEIAFRMHANGLKIANAHTAFVYTTVPKTPWGLIKQRTRWSQGFLQNSQDYSYMYFNPRYGNFGMLILPFSLTAFAAGLYSAGYALVRIGYFVWAHLAERWSTGVPLGVPASHLTWYYADTSMMTFLIIATLGMTLVAIVLGHRMAKTELGLKSFISYFALYGFIAPLWLARAAWGALRSQESAWR
jgi:biofilm PGA synthesis N-glycosyltransferase PgaC